MKFKIILKYKGKEYECEAPCWEEDYGKYKEWRSAFEFDGVRNCEHDYANLLPEEVIKNEEFGCEKKEIEVIHYWFE